MFKKILFFLGFLWCLPISILFWIFGVVLLLTKQIQKFEVNWDDFTFLWDLKNNGWFCKVFFLGRGWGGYSCGNNIIVVDSDTERWKRTIKHEQKHCHQQFILGVLFPVAYIIESLTIYFFEKDKHSYYSNAYERAARKYASQQVDIPKSQWKDGIDDRWCWCR